MAKSNQFVEFEDDYINEIYELDAMSLNIKDGAYQKRQMLKEVSTYSDAYNYKFQESLAIKVLPKSLEHYETFQEVLTALWDKKSKIDADEIYSEDPTCLIPILKKCKNIKEFKLSARNIKKDFTDLIPILVENCRLIEVLNIPGILLSEKDLVYLKEYTTLKMISINVDSTDAPLAELFANNLLLEHVEIIDRGESMNGICLRALPKSIQSIKLDNARHLDLTLLSQCESIFNLRFFSVNVFGTSSFLPNLIEVAPNIEKLELSTNQPQNYLLLSKLKKLNSFSLSQIGLYLVEKDIKNIAENCPNLYNLTLKYVNECITPETMEYLSKITPLRELTLKEYRDRKNLYGTCFRNLWKFENLDTLRVYNSDIRDEAFLCAIKGCRQLKCIMINQCRNITSDLVYAAVTEMNRDKLRRYLTLTMVFDELKEGMYKYENIPQKPHTLLNVIIKPASQQ